MIDVSLAFVRKVLDQYLVASFGQEGGMVILNSLINSDGHVPEKNKNKIVITLVNIVGGLVIGVVESFAGFYLPDGFKDTAPYIVVLAMLMLKPNGLFGEKLRKKV